MVTGGNVGLGLETARLLAQHGATVVLACRDQGKATAAAAEIRRSAPAARIDPLPLDLGSLDSVRSAVETLRTLHQRVDLLINNAGVMRPPRAVTSDGFELQLGTNHLGHFALTGLVLDLLLPLAGSRVVTVSSVLHHRGKIDFDDLQSVRRYDKAAAYAQSKLANLLFALDLDGRLTRSGAATISVAAHPGIARTTLSGTWSGRSAPSSDLSPSSRTAPPRVRCRSSAPPWTRSSAVASTSAPATGRASPAARSSPRPTAGRSTPMYSGGCGRSPNGSRASRTTSARRGG